MHYACEQGHNEILKALVSQSSRWAMGNSCTLAKYTNPLYLPRNYFFDLLHVADFAWSGHLGAECQNAEADSPCLQIEKGEHAIY